MLGWYFGVLHAEADQLERYTIDEIACKMAAQSPYVWDLWGALLAADPGTERRRLQRLLKKQEKGSKQEKKEMLPKGLEDEDEDVDSIDTVYGKLKKKFPLVQKRAIVETIEPILLYPWYGTGGWDL